ncbi:MAG: pitrilysin family protein [Synechococcaceae cyanobacterium ELA445]
MAVATEPSRSRLANGVEVVHLEMAEAPVVCLDFWCKAGSRLEEPEESGLAHFLEHMVFKGSRSLAPGEFDHRVESLGGSSNAATGFDDVHFHVLIPPEGASEALELLLELVLEPRLGDEDFQMERQVVLEELNQSEDQPEEVAFQTLLALACPNHSYGRAILGERSQLEGHQPAAMASFHSRIYQPGNISVALAGPLDQLDLVERIEAGPLAGLATTAATPPPAALALVAGRQQLELPRLEAARILMAWQLPCAHDIDGVMGGDLITTLLAEGRRSRLVTRLREELRLVESIDLDLTVLEAGSLALLEAVCAPAHVAAVEAEIGAIWRQLCDELPGVAELQRAQRLVANGHRFSLESAASVAGLMGSNCLWGRPLPLDAPLLAIEQWTVDRLQEEIVPLLDPERAFTLVALPA